MAKRDVTVHGTVVGKTKLGESDLIVRILSIDGSRVEAVAKGARRPQSALSARLEMLNEVHLLMHEGRTLGTVRECKLITDRTDAWKDPLGMACASLMAEFACKTSQVDLEVPRSHELLSAALDASGDAEPANSIAIAAAMILKGSSIMGLRPQLCACASCGSTDVLGAQRVSLSPREGGVICLSCPVEPGAPRYASDTVRMAEWLIRTPFDGIARAPMGIEDAMEALALAVAWSEAQFEIRMRSAQSIPSYIA